MTLQYNPTTGLDHHKETIVAGTPGATLLIHGDSGKASVGVAPGGGGTMRVEFTLSPLADISAAVWVPWANGDVATNKADTLDGPVTAVRGIATTANGTFLVIIAPRR